MATLGSYFRISALRLAMGLLVLGGTFIGPSSALGASSFCQPDLVVRDYLAPLAKFPTNMGFKPSGRLSVGPSVLRVFPPATRLVAAGHGQFDIRGRIEDKFTSRELGWKSISRLEQVSRRGSVKRQVKERQIQLRTFHSFDDRQFGFNANVRPGLYRLEVEFQTADGKKLRRYDEYFRVMEPRSALRLAVNPTLVSTGGAAQFRVENLGTVEAGFSYYVQLWNSLGQEVPVEQGVFSALSPPGIRPGEASECVSFKVPQELPAGEYRLGVRVRDKLTQGATVLTTSLTVTSS